MKIQIATIALIVIPLIYIIRLMIWFIERKQKINLGGKRK